MSGSSGEIVGSGVPTSSSSGPKLSETTLDALYKGVTTDRQAKTFLARSVSEHARRRVIYLIEHCMAPNMERSSLRAALEGELMKFTGASEFWEWVSAIERREKKLWDAVKNSDLTVLAELFKLGPEGLLWCRQGGTRATFMHQVIESDVLPVTILFANTIPPVFGRDVATMRDASGRTALHLAAYHLRVDHLRYLVPLPWVNVKVTDSLERNILHVFLRRLRSVRTSHKAGRKGEDPTTSESTVDTRSCFDVVQRAVQREPELASMRDKDGHTVMDYAVSLGDVAIVSTLLKAIRPHFDWHSLLKNSILLGSPALVSLFGQEVEAAYMAERRAGVEPGTMVTGGITAGTRADFICFAIENGKAESLHALLCLDFFRAALDAPAAKTGKRPLQVAVELGCSNNKNIKNNNDNDDSDSNRAVEALRTLLVKGAHPVFKFGSLSSSSSASSGGYDNAFALAAGRGNVDALRLLVLGATSSGTNGVSQAVRCPSDPGLGGEWAFQLQTSLDDDVDPRLIPVLKCSPLCAAAESGRAATLLFLLQQGPLLADLLDWPDGITGRTPLISACHGLHAECVAVLLRGGSRLAACAPAMCLSREEANASQLALLEEARKKRGRVVEAAKVVGGGESMTSARVAMDRVRLRPPTPTLI